MRSARAYLKVNRLQQGTALLIPVFLELKNNLLKSKHQKVNIIDLAKGLILTAQANLAKKSVVLTCAKAQKESRRHKRSRSADLPT